jgi:4-diphosphocytidyl-2-C-methyl-D-erythritol kinase
MIRVMNELFQLKLSEQQMIAYAASLGADCPFFILNRPVYAEGIGERMEPINLDLKGWVLGIVRPNIPVSTKEAFALIRPKHPMKCCRDIVMQPVETWKNELVNDFEESVFTQYPTIGVVKQQLYDLGATYAAMSGSGSALFGLFRAQIDLAPYFKDMFVETIKL